jgi:hypothetical protein
VAVVAVGGVALVTIGAVSGGAVIAGSRSTKNTKSSSSQLLLNTFCETINVIDVMPLNPKPSPVENP